MPRERAFVGLEDERRDRFGEWMGCGVCGTGGRKKRGRVLRQEIPVEEIEMNRHPITGFGLQSRGFHEGDGKLITVRRSVA